MIEIIYSNEEKDKGKSNTMLKVPKNIRQVGGVESGKKIYIEDYVITYINQLAGKDYVNQYVAVLLGQQAKIEGKKSLFISGAVEVKDVQTLDQDQIFTNDTWTTIYDTIKKYFNDLEIVGWFLAIPGEQAELTKDIIKNHVDNFAGADKALFMLDSIEKEEALYIYENNELKKQAGYYIYYDKNEEMQNYMVEEREIIPVEIEKEDVIVRDMRTIIADKKQETGQKNFVNLLYGASTVLVIVVLVIGVTMLNNYDKMKAMEETLNTISQNITSKRNEDNEVNEDDQVVEAINQNVTTKVDKVESNIQEISEAPEKLPPTTDVQENTKVTEEPQTKNETITEAIKIERTTTESKDESGKTVRYYEISSGDTLAEICRSLYNSTQNIELIQEINEIDDPNMIFAGQKIIVP